MSPVDGIGNVDVVGAPGSAVNHSGHGAGSAPTFATALANTLANSPAGLPGALRAQAATPAAALPSRHLPLDGQHRQGNHGYQEMVLGLRAYRQQLLASNIANADTPNYKAVDIDFREAVRIAQAAMAGGGASLTTTDGRHLAGVAPRAPYGVPLQYRVPQQASADGNTVDLNVERAQIAENAVMYEFSVDRVKGHYMMMIEMFKNLPY